MDIYYIRENTLPRKKASTILPSKQSKVKRRKEKHKYTLISYIFIHLSYEKAMGSKNIFKILSINNNSPEFFMSKRQKKEQS